MQLIFIKILKNLTAKFKEVFMTEKELVINILKWKI